jgi:hypothetical protein
MKFVCRVEEKEAPAGGADQEDGEGSGAAPAAPQIQGRGESGAEGREHSHGTSGTLHVKFM